MAHRRTVEQLWADLAEAETKASHHASKGRREIARRWRDVARVTRKLIARRQPSPSERAPMV